MPTLPERPESKPPEAWSPLFHLAQRARGPLERFLHVEAASGILLLVAAAVALVLASSPWGDAYRALLHLPLGVSVGDFVFQRPLEWFVNDGLMVIFFFVVGLEIRREIHCGELSEWRRASLPVAAALGGMLAPAGIYLLLAGQPSTHSGWGVPMATDIAFAVGILTLLGKRVPPALRVLLLALAVIDDLGAIVVIAVFYSAGISWSGLLVAAAGVVALLLMQRMGMRQKLAYVPAGLVVWGGVYAAGIHPTIAGVIVGMLTPVRAWLGPEGFVAGMRQEIAQLERSPSAPPAPVVAEAMRHVSSVRREALSPAESLIHILHPWVAFGIMPVFALVNAGVSLAEVSFEGDSRLVTTGVGLGLLFGKPIGIILACVLTVKLGVAKLPVGITGRHLLVLGTVAGVGFTMALFIAQLAFADATLLSAGKLGVLAASGVAGVLALGLGVILLPKAHAPGAAATAAEAEASTEL